MDKLSNLIPRVLRRRGLNDEATASYVTYLANQWIEDNLVEHKASLHVFKLTGCKLFIHSDHPIASQELSLVQEQLTTYLNSHEAMAIDEIMISRS
jgi:hypothetical protein